MDRTHAHFTASPRETKKVVGREKSIENDLGANLRVVSTYSCATAALREERRRTGSPDLTDSRVLDRTYRSDADERV